MNPPLLLLHGFTGSAQTMSDLAAEIKGHKTICMDLPGHGESVVSTSLRHYKFPAQRHNISNLLKAQNIQKIHLLGYSMGARIALDFALKNQEKISSLILISATAGLMSRSQRRDRRIQDRALAKSIQDRDKDGMKQFVKEWMSQPLFASQSRLGQKYLKTARMQRMKNSPIGLANTLKGTGTGSMKPLWDKLHKLNALCLIITGAEDGKFSALGKQIHTKTKNGILLEILEAGHAPHLEKQVLTAGLIAEFLDYSNFRRESGL